MEDVWQKKLERAIRKRRTYNRGYIYRLDNQTLAKERGTVGEPHSIPEYLIREYLLGKRLYEEGVQVPEFKGLIMAKTSSVEPQKIYVLMEWIKGKQLNTLSGPTLERAIEQHKQQVKRVIDLGVVPGDLARGSNSIFNQREGKLYILDLDGWLQKTTAEKLGQDLISHLETSFYPNLRADSVFSISLADRIRETLFRS